MFLRQIRWMTLIVGSLSLAAYLTVSIFAWIEESTPDGPTVLFIPAGVVVGNPGAPVDVAALARYQMYAWIQRGSLIVAALSLAAHLVVLNIGLSMHASQGMSAPD